MGNTGYQASKLPRFYNKAEPWRAAAHSKDMGKRGLVLHWDQVRTGEKVRWEVRAVRRGCCKSSQIQAFLGAWQWQKWCWDGLKLTPGDLVQFSKVLSLSNCQKISQRKKTEEMSRFVPRGIYKLNVITAVLRQMDTHTDFFALHLISKLKSLTPIICSYTLENS